jgi:predicted methyltransferase
MVTIHVYGRLRKAHRVDREVGTRGVIDIEVMSEESLASLLLRLGISPEELYTVLLNARLLTTKSKMASHLGYQQVSEDCHNWDLSTIIRDGDHLALFGRDMATLVV